MRILRSSILAITVGFAIVGLANTPVRAANFSFTGSLLNDASAQLFNFTVGAPSTVTLLTYSYAGGTNNAGNTISRGGFDPVLALFGPTGAIIGQNDDGASGQVGTDTVTGNAYDTYYQSNLNAGNYTVAIMQYDNFPIGPNLSNGFTESLVDFTSRYGCSEGIFCDAGGDNRTNQWAFDVLGADQAVALSAVPLPASLPLFLTGLAGLGIAGRRRRKSGLAA